MQILTCPFCGYETASNYGIEYHLMSQHSEGDSPFIVRERNSQNTELSDAQGYSDASINDLNFVECTQEGCGEAILLSELASHIEMHSVEEYQTDESYFKDPNFSRRPESSNSKSELGSDAKLPQPFGNLVDEDFLDAKSSSNDPQTSAKLKWREILKMPTSKEKQENPNVPKRACRRLGKSELGPYAHEKQMPQWLQKLLETDGQLQTIRGLSNGGRLSKVNAVGNHVAGVIPVITGLLRQDSSTRYAYTCHPCVQHITKMQKEGGFCGYRNIQMMISYVIATESQAFHHFQGKVPTIFQIQDAIEHAWDLGINSQCRLETGGIRGTRKYIGTPEAQAMLISLGISCNARGLKGKGSSRADQQLLRYVEEYFSSSCVDTEERVQSTALPPLYFQYPGHSITIIGFEKKKDDTVNLLVFDPMFRDSSDIIKLIGQSFKHENPSTLLRAYQRTVKHLRKHDEFEILSLTPL